MNEYIRGRWLEFVLGIVVLCGAIAFVLFAINEIEGQSGLLKRTYFMHFSNIGGLKEQDKVSIGGVDIGRVAVISVDEELLLPKVTISVWHGFDLPADTEARILSAGLLGGAYLSITPGVSQDNLESRSQIVRTVDAESLEDYISRMLLIVQKKVGQKEKAAQGE